MAGAGPRTSRVDVVNANWVPGGPGTEGHFQFLLVTEDDERHVVDASPAEVTAVVGLLRAGTVPLWDPDTGTLIVGNVVGDWFPADWSNAAVRAARPEA